MRVFLSYAAKDRNLAEAVSLALRAQGHTLFFDRTDLPPGEEYDVRIRRGIEKSQLFVFLLSPDAVDAGSYTLTELGIAQEFGGTPQEKSCPSSFVPFHWIRSRLISSRSLCWNPKATCRLR